MFIVFSEGMLALKQYCFGIIKVLWKVGIIQRTAPLPFYQISFTKFQFYLNIDLFAFQLTNTTTALVEM